MTKPKSYATISTDSPHSLKSSHPKGISSLWSEHGVVTRIYYDKEKQVPKKIRDAQDNTTLLYHNEKSELIKTISPNGAETEYEYNQQGELMSIINPLKGRTTLEYDEHGNLVKKTDAKNNTTIYSYTREQQLKSRSNAFQKTIETKLNAKTSTKSLNYLNLTVTTHNDFKQQRKSIFKKGYDHPITIEYDKNGVETMKMVIILLMEQ